MYFLAKPQIIFNDSLSDQYDQNLENIKAQERHLHQNPQYLCKLRMRIVLRHLSTLSVFSNSYIPSSSAHLSKIPKTT